MRYWHITVKRAMDRVETFLETNKAPLGDVNESKGRTDFDAAMAEFKDSAAQQAAADTYSRSLTKLKNTLRDDLRMNHMRPIAVIAQTEPTPSGDTGIGKLRLPRQRASDRDLIASAMAMAELAAAHRAMFLAHKLPETFVDDLRAAIDAFSKALDDRTAARQQHVKATEAMVLAVRRGGRRIYVLDSLVVKKLAGRKDLLAAWNIAKRYTHKPGGPGRPDAGATGEAAPPPTLDATAAAP